MSSYANMEEGDGLNDTAESPLEPDERERKLRERDKESASANDKLDMDVEHGKEHKKITWQHPGLPHERPSRLMYILCWNCHRIVNRLACTLGLGDHAYA